MKVNWSLIGIIFIVSLVFSCNPNNKPKEFDYGTVTNSKYINTYFGLEIDLPSDWIVATKEQTDNLTKMGTELVVGDNANLKAVLKAAEVNNATLLNVNQYEIGSAVDFNSSLILIAENLKNVPGIKKGSDYLFQSRKLLKQSQIKYDYIDEEFQKEIINNQEFYLMNCKINFMGFNIKQVYYSTIINGFSLNVIISFVDDEQKIELKKIIESMKFQ